MPDLMEQAIEAAFQKVLEDSLQPLVVRLTDLEVQITALRNSVDLLTEQQKQVTMLVEAFKGNGLAKHFLPKGV